MGVSQKVILRSLTEAEQKHLQSRYWWRSVKLSVFLSFLPQSSSSIFDFATNIILG